MPDRTTYYLLSVMTDFFAKIIEAFAMPATVENAMAKPTSHPRAADAERNAAAVVRAGQKVIAGSSATHQHAA